jgi:mutator protein MutT
VGPVGDGEHRVVAGLLRRGDRVLLCHRTADRRWYPDCWDLPGGHVEDGETPERALVRELREELGVEVVAPLGAPFARVREAGLDLSVWVVERWSGEPADLAPAEHDAVAWVDLAGAAGLRLADPRVLDLVRAALGDR